MNKAVTAMLVSLALSVAAVATAQTPADSEDLRSLRQNIDAFTSVLEEALGLNQSTGLFGMAVGGTESTYLQGQGVVIEVRTPLANQRNRLSLASLNSAMQSLAARNNPFEAMRQQTTFTAPEADLAAANSSQADSFYNDMMDRIASIDFSLAVDSALQQAGNAARSLRSLGELEGPAYQSAQGALDDLRERVAQRQNDLRTLQDQVLAASTEAASESQQQTLSERLDNLLAQLQPLREEAEEMATQLNAQIEQAAVRHEQDWQQEFLAFEEQLYTTMCDFGASLRDLPESENISVILSGLGEDAADNRRTDKVHVFSLADLRACQRGGIDVAALRERSTAYSY